MTFDIDNLNLVMGDVQRGDAQPPLQLAQLHAHALAQLGVEIAQRLVQQQHLRLAHQRPRQGETLLLSAGKLGCHALFIAAQLHLSEGVADFFANVVIAEALLADPKGKRDVFEHREMGPDRVALKYHANGSPIGRSECALDAE